MQVYVSEIQRFCLHDGPGIRTTVFLQGCSVKCPWCCNPEAAIPVGSINESQPSHNPKMMQDNELFNEIISDKAFYGVDGGVTFSGGEPLLQANSLEPLLERLHSEKVSICFETSLFAPKRNLMLALKYADFVYADIKILDFADCRAVLCGDASVYLDNLKLLTSSKCDYAVRFPVVHGYTDGKKNLTALFSAVEELGIKKIELLKYHHLGERKYLDLGVSPPDITDTPDSIIDHCAMELGRLGVTVDVLSL